MMGVPSLYAKNPRTRKLEDVPHAVPPQVVHKWTAMEMIPGAPVRVTVRNHEAVRLEVVAKPSDEQRKTGIEDPWYRDASQSGAELWLWEAVKTTSFDKVPDGEWFGEAIGENINRNSMDIEGHRIVLSSLFPWRDSMEGVDIPPHVGRVPFEFDDLRFWLATTTSSYPHSRRDGIPIDGVVWWHDEIPVSQIRSRDFPKITRAPNEDAELPEIYEEGPFVWEG